MSGLFRSRSDFQMMTLWIDLMAGLRLHDVGAQLLVKGGAALARRLGLNALMAGRTVMAYGGSSPE